MNNKYIKKLVKCHNHLIKKTHILSNDLMLVNGGGQVFKTLDACLTLLNGGVDYRSTGDSISDQKIVSYCVYNVHRMTQIRSDYLDFFKPAQIFGQAGVNKFLQSSVGSRYYEKLYLSSIGVTIDELMMLIVDKDKHPHAQYIYPEYEDRTKKRALNTDAGLYLCVQSTLLWAPKSPVCKECKFVDKCKDILKNKYSELYRIRIEDNEIIND